MATTGPITAAAGNTPPQAEAVRARPAEQAAASRSGLISKESIQEVARKTGASIEINQEELKAAIEELKQLSDAAGRNLGFSMDQVMNRPVVVVSDKDSGKVVRQIPAEVVIKVAHSIEQMKGILFDETL
jgi:flagellar protein FlaG